jgi:hypothetical protein
MKPSLGVSNWPIIYYIFPRQLGTEVLCRRCRVLKKKLSHHHHRAISHYHRSHLLGNKAFACGVDFLMGLAAASLCAVFLASLHVRIWALVSFS